MRAKVDRRRFVQAAAGSLLLPWCPTYAQAPSRTLRIERRPPAEQARADANLNTAERHALVIGNSRYTGISPLRNPANDATAIAEQLKGARFQVDMRQDLPRAAMLDAINNYVARVAAAKGVGLFFFAGHGLQLQWRNFLVPVDAQIEKLEDIPARCVDLGALISGITKASNPMNVVVLDACRDNPFSDVKMESKGLSQLDAPPGTLLAYATSPGNVASDGEGANGMYTENLLRELKAPEAKIEDVFKRVRLNVRRRSNGQQIPWESTSLEEDFYFLPPKEFRPVAQSEANRQFEVELAAWEKIKATNDAAPLEDFLRRYPSGRFSELAQLRLDRVLGAQGEKRILAQTEANPFSQGTAVADTTRKVGDTYTVRVLDLLTKLERGRATETITQVSDSEVRYDSGRITDLLGNPIVNRNGQRFTSQQNFPTEYKVGKRWSTRSRITLANGMTGDTEMDFVVAGREKVTVEAGTFNAFRVEGRGTFALPGYSGTVELKIWTEPDKVRQVIVLEDLRKAGSKFLNTERYELVSFKQS